MEASIAEHNATILMQNRTNTNAAQIFAIVQQVSSQINVDNIQEAVDRTAGLDIKDRQLVVDLLGIALENNYPLLKNADRVLLLLTRIVLSTKVFAQNRTIKFEYITHNVEQPPGVYQIRGEPPTCVKVEKRGKEGATEIFTERLVAWAHLSHANVLPTYWALLEGKDGPVSLVSPVMAKENIVDYARPLSQVARMPLICDVIDGLCYLHSLNIVHGTLNPQNILISQNGRVLITGLDSLFESEDSQLSSARYSAPELLGQDDTEPKTSSDIWSLGCVIYQVLSGKIPFYQIRQEVKVSIAIFTGQKPIRPGQEGKGVEEIGDAIWGPVSTCWASEAKDRPTSLQIQKTFSSKLFHDDRPLQKPTILPEAVESKMASALDLELGRVILKRIVGAGLSVSLASQIPERVQKPLFGLLDNQAKAEAVAVAATKLNPSDTQILVDVLDLVWDEAPIPVANDPIDKLLSKLMTTTHTFPQRYRLNRVRYDPGPITEGNFGKLYRGCDLEICVTMVTNPSYVSAILNNFTLWIHSEHSVVLPLYGVFHESHNEISRFCVVSPYLKNGLMRDYAPNLPQKDRVPLIFDVINALVYLQGLKYTHYDVRGDRFLITNEGRALIGAFGLGDMVTSLASVRPPSVAGPYGLRFYSPERAKMNEAGKPASIWSFGCLIYEVLSRKPPYHQYTEDKEIRSALSRGELPRRPSATDKEIDEINDQFWNLIMECCVSEPAERLTLLEIQKLLKDMNIQDDRPETASLSGAEVLALRSPPDINWDYVKQLLDQIQVELLRNPLSKLVQNHTKDVAASAARLKPADIRTLVDFLDLALKNHITLSDQRNRVLALLSRITTSTHIFPRRYELESIKYHTSPMAGGAFGTVHRGVSDQNICVKVMVKVDADALMNFVKELILWAHASHQNVLPFYGVFIDESERICLVSPYMNKGNLCDYGPQLPQKKRIPLLHDVIQGLIYLHGIGVVHTDLKGENVLISDEGRGLITDFGASHVITATAKGGATTGTVISTLRFAAPEIISNRNLRPTQECDIWSFGCLCYELLSRKAPYFEYGLEVQIYAALVRGELPKRPTLLGDNVGDNESWDEFDEPDWDEIDDPAWGLITRCCVPKPEDRLTASRIQELIVDLKMWDDRPGAKNIPGAHLLSLRSNPDIDLNRVGELLSDLEVRFLAQNTLRYSTADVIAAVAKLYLSGDDKQVLVEFWDLVLKRQLFTSKENSQTLALLSALIYTSRKAPSRFTLLDRIQYSRTPIAKGSLGTIHRGSDPNLCIKVTNFNKIDSNIDAQVLKALAPSAYSSHPNILPFYGTTYRNNLGFLVSPFMSKGNFLIYALRLPQKSQMLLILDVVQALVYLHNLGIVHGNLKGENILISDEGRALVADFRPYHINIASTERGPTGSYVTSTLRFTAPELVKNSQMLPTTKSDIWSIGCLFYLVCSGKVPFYQYLQDAAIRSALSRGELPAWPVPTSDSSSKTDDLSWDLANQCCVTNPDDRPALLDIQRWLASLGIEDIRPPAKPTPGAKILELQYQHPGIDVERVGDLLTRIKSQLPPISKDGDQED